MKKTLALVLTALLVLSVPLTVLADAPVNLTTKGSAAAFLPNAKPFINDSNYTMVPLSYAETLGIRTAWNSETQTAVLINIKYVVATVTETTVNGTAAASGLNLTVNNKVPYIKLRGLADIFGLTLNWNGFTSTVDVSTVLTKPVAAKKELILATTTSTKDSGLLEFLLPEFKKDTGITVKDIAVGSGAAMKMGEDGEADIMMVHSPAAEIASIGGGHAISRVGLMYNDYVIVGPKNDPANVKAAGGDAVSALKAIQKAGSVFVSRGDNSGTDVKEKSLWTSANVKPLPKNYLEAATGMGATLNIAEQRGGYTLADRATYLKLRDTLELVILCEGDPLLLNPYSVMVVNPAKNRLINVMAAMQFSEWLTSERGQALINAYGVEQYGAPLFFANYKPAF